jgi:NADH-quinone oxidoreductase subunit J
LEDIIAFGAAQYLPYRNADRSVSESLMLAFLFILFAGMAVGCALAMVAQRNPLYSAISLIGVFVSLACLYIMLAAPFIAAVQVIVYAGAIMVLVVFVIMLLNVEHEERRPTRLKFLVPLAVVLAAVLIAEVAFVLVTVRDFGTPVSNVGLTHSIGSSLFTIYLLPFEITSILLLMAMVGAMTLAQRGGLLSANARVVPGSQQLPLSIVDPRAEPDDLRVVETDTTDEAARLLGVDGVRDQSKRD